MCALKYQERREVPHSDVRFPIPRSDVISNLFHAQASFGLANDLRRRTSGGASAALMLSHWERLQVNLSSVPSLHGHNSGHLHPKYCTYLHCTGA